MKNTIIPAIALTIATATTAVAHAGPEQHPPAWACGAKGYVFEAIQIEGGVIHQRWYCDDGRKTQTTIMFDTNTDNSPSNVGPAGKDGKDGTNGTDGSNGVDGKDGKDGKRGKRGKRGPKGKDGKDGKGGKDGKDKGNCGNKDGGTGKGGGNTCG